MVPNLAAARGSHVDARAAMSSLGRTAGWSWALVRSLLGWVRGHMRWVAAFVGIAMVLRVFGNLTGFAEALVLAFGPALVAAVWMSGWPVGYERVCAGP